MAKKKHITPKHLDYLFTRQVIPANRYAEYWEGYWNSRSAQRSRWTDSYISSIQTRLPKSRRQAGTITRTKKAAQEQADNIGGYIARVTKTGRRSKKGKFWRAFPKTSKRGKNK